MGTSVCCSREWSGEELSAGRFDVIYLTGRRTREGRGLGGGARGEREREKKERCDFCVAKSPQETGRLFLRMGVMI